MKIELNQKEVRNLFYWLNVAEDYINSKEALDEKEKLQKDISWQINIIYSIQPTQVT